MGYRHFGTHHHFSSHIRHESSHIVTGAWIQTPVVSSRDGLCLHVLWYCYDAAVCMYILIKDVCSYEGMSSRCDTESMV